MACGLTITAHTRPDCAAGAAGHGGAAVGEHHHDLRGGSRRPRFLHRVQPHSPPRRHWLAHPRSEHFGIADAIDEARQITSNDAYAANPMAGELEAVRRELGRLADSLQDLRRRHESRINRTTWYRAES